jgi:hypothetical protein
MVKYRLKNVKKCNTDPKCRAIVKFNDDYKNGNKGMGYKTLIKSYEFKRQFWRENIYTVFDEPGVNTYF